MLRLVGHDEVQTLDDVVAFLKLRAFVVQEREPSSAWSRCDAVVFLLDSFIDFM